MAKNLVIVESPAKAKTIEKFLGKDFQVKSCFGHIRDLDKGDDAIDIQNGFKPKYIIPSDKKAVVDELKSLSGKADQVWLASDEDREGEAISWHLAEVLNLQPSNTKRIVFHEITKPAILKAIENPREIDKNLVDAQQARRLLDRLVGFELSPVLWKKVKPSLSAGRVQSVAVRLVVEREREILSFKSKSYFKVVAEFEFGNKKFKAELSKRYETKEDAMAFLERCKGSDFKVEGVEVKPSVRKPAAPFTTSTLQQEASRKLGYSVSQTMRLAQRLYESGLITYMRTDSVNLSDLAINDSKQEIVKNYGEEFSAPKKYSTKSAGAQEAHEAIRPTYFSNQSAGDDDQQKKLYELIWKRSIASQMSPARIERTEVRISISGISPDDQPKLYFMATGEVIVFEGFLKVYLESKDEVVEEEETESGIMPALKKGDLVKNNLIIATQRFSRPAPRYTEASLVKDLEELGIGRPSTYAPTISTIQKRGYVEKESREGILRNFELLELINDEIKTYTRTENTGAEKNKLFPTDIGSVVTDFLMKNFDHIMDYNFTASVEKEFDEIAEGMQAWTKMLESFYHPFHESVDKTLKISEKVTGERELGAHPKTGLPVFAKIGRYGPMIQVGDGADDVKPVFAKLKKGQSIDTITLEEAVELFALPRTLDEFENKILKVGLGRFGPYIQHDGKFYSLGKEDDPYSVGMDRAVEIILNKRKADAEKEIKVFQNGIKILNGRFGPYINLEKENFKIPKGTDPKNLSLEDCEKIIKDTKDNPKAKTAFKKKKKA
ncbi:MAG: type I DNA topoisomerase [Flavobacteriales bacterium]|nr:type I DNA topoisomerase [Flavobacteriales bacterium]